MNKIVRKLSAVRLVLLMLLLGSGASASAADKVYISDFGIKAGEMKEIAIQYEGDASAVKYLKGKITLPGGLVLVNDAYGQNIRVRGDEQRSPGATANMNPKTGELIIASNFAPFAGSEGAIGYITVTTNINFEPAVKTIALTGFVAVAADGTETPLADSKTTVTRTTPHAWLAFKDEQAVEMLGGESRDIEVEMTNVSDVTYLETKLGVGQKLTIDTVKLSERGAAARYEATTGKYIAEGGAQYRDYLPNSPYKIFKGSKGTVFTIRVSAAKGFMGKSTVTVKGAVATDPYAKTQLPKDIALEVIIRDKALKDSCDSIVKAVATTLEQTKAAIAEQDKDVAKDYEAPLAAFAPQIENLQKSVDEGYQDLTLNKETVRQQAEALRQAIAAQKAAADAAQKAVDEQKAKEAANAAAYERLSQELAALQQQLADARKNVEEQDKDVAADYKDEFDKLQQQIDAAQKALDEARDKVELTADSKLDIAADFGTQVEQTKAAADAAQKAYEEQKAREAANAAAYERLSQELAALQQQLDDARKHIGEQDKDVAADYQEALDKLQQQIDAAKKALDEAKEKVELTEDSKLDIAADFPAQVEQVKTDADAAQKAYDDAHAVVKADFESGKYYLKNTASGLFWGAGNDWGTRASLLEHAEYVTLLRQDDGAYQLESQVSNGGTAYYFNGDYMDNGSPLSLTIGKTDTEGVYTIANPTGERFGYDGTTTVLGKNVGEGEASLWQVLTQEQMDKALAKGSVNSPADATYRILDPNFGRNNRNQGAWQVTYEGVAYNLSGGNNINNCAEAYMATFDINQTVENLPNGLYLVKAQGAVTYHDNRAIKDYDGQGAPQFYAGSQSADFIEMESADRLTNMGQLSEQFTAGKYELAPLTVEVTDGTLTVGFRSARADIWAIWDNVRLYYMGEAVNPELLKTESELDVVNKDEAKTKNTDVIGLSVTLPGDYNAGSGSAMAGAMTSKGYKLRTANGAPVKESATFTVNKGYTVVNMTINAISNYASKDETVAANVKVTRVEADGVEVNFEGGEFPAKGSADCGTLTVKGIKAKKSITLYFDNSNSSGSQLNIAYSIDYLEPQPAKYEELLVMDFEQGEAADYWKKGNGYLVTPDFEGTTGQAASVKQGSDRADFILTPAELEEAEKYSFDMDLAIVKGAKTAYFAVMSQSAPDDVANNWGWFWVTTAAETHNPYLFELTIPSGTTAIVNEAKGELTDQSQTWEFTEKTWYHLTLKVDVESRTVAYTVTEKTTGAVVLEGTYTLPEGDSPLVKGVYERNNRYNYDPGTILMDNIVISTGEKEVVGIAETVVKSLKADGAVYTISGRKVADAIEGATLPKGIYIVGGKKIVVK